MVLKSATMVSFVFLIWVRLSSMGAVGAGCVKEMVVGGQGFVVDGDVEVVNDGDVEVAIVKEMVVRQAEGFVDGGGSVRRRGAPWCCSSVSEGDESDDRMELVGDELIRVLVFV
ncbi:hypothetical protein Dimus_029743 [Dionaea muscipula]